jgi:hypothetical protein
MDRNAKAKLLFAAEALERSTKPRGGRRGVLGYVGLTTLKALMRCMNRQTGLCCPSIKAIQEATGLSRSAIFEALARLEAAGIVKRVRRLTRRVINFGGLARLATTQATNLYSFSDPHPTAHLLPTRKPSRRAPARLIAALVKSFSPRAESAERSGSIFKVFSKGETSVFGG